MYSGGAWDTSSHASSASSSREQQERQRQEYAAAQQHHPQMGLAIGAVSGQFAGHAAYNGMHHQQQHHQQQQHHHMSQQPHHSQQADLGALTGLFGGFEPLFGVDTEGAHLISDGGSSAAGASSSSGAVSGMHGNGGGGSHYNDMPMDYDLGGHPQGAALRAYAAAAGSQDHSPASLAFAAPHFAGDQAGFATQNFGRNPTPGHVSFQDVQHHGSRSGSIAGQGGAHQNGGAAYGTHSQSSWSDVHPGNTEAEAFAASLQRKSVSLDPSQFGAAQHGSATDLSSPHLNLPEDASMGMDTLTPQAAARYTQLSGLQPTSFDQHAMYSSQQQQQQHPHHQAERPGSASSLQGAFGYGSAPGINDVTTQNGFGHPHQQHHHQPQHHHPSQTPQQFQQYHSQRLSAASHSPISPAIGNFTNGSSSSSSLHAAFSQSVSRSSSQSGLSASAGAGAGMAVDEKSRSSQQQQQHPMRRASGQLAASSHNGLLSTSDSQGSFYSSPDLGIQFGDGRMQNSPAMQVPPNGSVWQSQLDTSMTDSPAVNGSLAATSSDASFVGYSGGQAATAALPQPTTAMLPDFDISYRDTSLASAMAHNAQIGSQAGTRAEGGGSTPTIVEEEEEDGAGAKTKLGADKLRPSSSSSRLATDPSQNQTLESPSLADGSDDRSAAGNARRASYNTQQLQAQSQVAAQSARTNQQAESGVRVMTLPRRYRPMLRPSTFQQASNLRPGEEFQSPDLSDSTSMQDTGDCLPFIARPLENYLAAASRLGLGERTVLIMTSKVAQKSYGAEKRFLCPPPMVLLIGSSWWSACANDPSVSFSPKPSGPSSELATTLAPPKLTIAISGESHAQDGNLEWASSNGRLIDVGGPSAEMAISGRCIGKQLYITDFDEKRRYCEAQVSITVPGATINDRRLLGTFSSKQIKVISKPSKKRQSSRNADLCVNHGTVISLFHRLRSQTVSTRYLCVSGPPTWFKGSDGQPFVNTAQDAYLPSHTDPPSCFVAKMSSWDPFIIYLVDPRKRSDATPNNEIPPPVPGYPPPPANALPMSNYGGNAIPIFYNQPVVLQCLHTAVVSPIMIIRRVDKGTTVLGGSQAAGASSTSGPSNPSREAPGDPVSQLHKISLEVLENYNVPAPTPGARDEKGESRGPGISGPFLACLNEAVGMRKPAEPRRWVNAPASTPTTPVTPVVLPQSSDGAKVSFEGQVAQDPNSVAAAYAAAQTKHAMTQSRPGGVSGSLDPPPSSDGGKVKRPRRVSSSVVQQKERAATAAKNRRRGQSMSTLGLQNQMQQQQLQQQQASSSSHPANGYDAAAAKSDTLRRTTSFANSNAASDSSVGNAPSCASWSVDVSDSDVWTIVGTDIARHTFYIPPKIVGGARPQPAHLVDSSVSHLITVPAPRGPLAPIPVLSSFVAASTSGVGSTPSGKQPTGDSPLVTLFGDNFTEDLFIFFGDWRSEQVEVQSVTTIVCAPPPSMEFGAPRGKVPITFVRKDGVVFPTESIYSC